MGTEAIIGKLLEQLDGLSPSGFAIAMHIKFTAPKYLFQAYSKDWMAYYSKQGLVLHDPTVRWGFENTGLKRWSELEDTDGVMAKAAEHGLRYGFVIVVEKDGSRSLSSFARADREFTDAEIAEISGIVERLHDETLATEALSPADHAALKRLSISLTHRVD